MSGIFISYRREDSQGFAGRLEDDLSERFGDDLIFRDREIVPGDHFVETLREMLDATDVALVVIGPRWVDCRDEDGLRRLDAEDDWVRIEIETMLRRDVPVVPVLVGGARMPDGDELPEGLTDFCRRQAFPLSDLRWRDEIDELADRLATLSPDLERAYRASGGDGRRSSPSASLRETATRVFDELEARQRALPPPRRAPGWLRWLGAWAKKVATTAVTLGIVYIAIREFGGPELNAVLDRFVARTLETLRSLTTP